MWKQVVITLIFLVVIPISHAQVTLQGKIIEANQESMSVKLQDGSTVATPNDSNYKLNEEVFVVKTQNNHYISDHNRIKPLLILLIIFVLTVVLISKKHGFYALFGMAYSFLVIIWFTLPLLLKGTNPLLISILTCSLIAPVTFYLSHGFNKKTTLALFSTLFTLLITGILSGIFIELAKITGFTSDEAFFLQIAKQGTINMQGIYLAGVIIGTLGILDDITISQSAIVQQLKSSIRNIDEIEIYKKAMDIGHDHIASAVNTLILVYTGAALPLLLLFVNSSRPIYEAINAEIVAAEIVRTLIGSIGLILAVPISTLVATLFLSGKSDSK